MAKFSSQYVCQQCGYSQVGWSGKCPECGSWNSLVETVVEEKSGTSSKGRKSGFGKFSSQPISLASIKTKNTKRILTRITELDRVLGGGLISGQVVLVAGEPGIGKSTLLLQVADKLSGKERKFLYISGEESVNQIAVRAQRLGINNKGIILQEQLDVDSIVEAISKFSEKQHDLDKKSSTKSILSGVVVDSIQTITTNDLAGMAGSVGQVRESAYRLVKTVKRLNIPLFIVGHVTKQGSVAGPSVLMHIVDSVLWFEGDKIQTTRLLRAVKNRFGPTDEVGIFTMENRGLLPVDKPENLFIYNKSQKVPGSVTCCVVEGVRPIMVEVQALVVPSKSPYPKRVSQGIDLRKFDILLAVLSKRCGIPIFEQDCVVNLAGGINIKNDPSIDLAVCLALASAFMNKPLLKGTVAIGEVGLLGELRKVPLQDKRIKEAKRLGYKNIISSASGKYLSEVVRKFLK